MSFGNTCLKTISAIFQTTFIIAGLALVAYGSFTAYIILVTNSEQVIKEYVTILPSAITILFGLVLVILVIVGCCGICRESKYCVESYASFLILLAFSQLAFGGYCIIVYGNPNYTRSLSMRISADIENAVTNYKDNPEKMDNIQNWMKCCGHVNAVNEYNFYRGQLPNQSELPPSCCGGSIVTCTFDTNELHTKGCSETVSQFTIVTNYIMGWISVVVGSTELIAALLGICLSCCIWRNQIGSWR
ncbi:CD63 antigen-like isoform X2 [Anoplophora glabripennis]|uniref:CD63 antigen-like isoform X2 n=1 Tax=Anoplophora glabripennis TaxID=217634 RepID=UPI0008735BBE|nr:CD63 antigen-like isoform X2 [Anoplophora glabripennis]